MAWFQVHDQLKNREEVSAIVEAEEFAGGPMTVPTGVDPELHRLFGPCPRPAPPAAGAPKPRIWIVRGTNGQDIRVLAERHTTYARPEGTELRFYDGDGDDQHRVATVRAGSWHWVVEASALNPEGGEQ